MLHLQGFDHVKNDDAEKMEQLEVNILHQLGFDNPY
jgi:probable rRNA maturation factor